MLDADTKRRIDTARDVLVGKLPDPKTQVEQITIALIYKFMDDMDKQSEELGGKAKFFTGEYEKYAWSKIFDSRISGHELVGLYGEAILRMNQNPNIPQLFRDIFKNAYLPYRDPETLKGFLKTIDAFEYDHSEKLGDAFEYLLSIMGSQGDAGQFRTPRHIIDFIVKVVNPTKDDLILDPACGTAGFLISAYKHILESNVLEGHSSLTVNEKKRLTESVVGYDISPDMVRLSLVNLYLHGFSNPKISEYDTLTSEEKWNEYFDVILANPPFMTPKGGIRPHKRFSVQANRSEVLFVDYIHEHLTPNGRAGIVVPEGIIFQNGTAYRSLRKMLLEQSLYAVVSLPAGVFNPYSGVKTSILLLDKTIAKRTNNVLFVKIGSDGYNLGAQRREIKENDLPLALEIIHDYQKTVHNGQKLVSTKFGFEGFEIAHVVSKERIVEQEYNLSGDRYKEAVVYDGKWDLVELSKLEEEGHIDFLRGQGISKKDIVEKGKYKCIHYGDLYTLYNPIIKRVKNETNFEGRVLSVKGDVLVPATTTADPMGIAVARALNEDGVVLGGDINIIRTKNKIIDSKFLSLLLNYPLKEQLSKFAKGVNIYHLSNSDIKKLQIPLPPIEVQERIVEEIESYQNIIDGAKKVVESYKPSFKIESDWEVVELGSLGKVNMCKRIFKNQTTDYGEIPFYKIGTFGGKPDAFITQELFNEFKAKFSYPNKGDILISTSGTIGKIVVFDGKPAYFQDSNIVWIDNDETKILNKFLFIIYKSITWVPTRGGTIARLYNSIIEKTKIPLPPIETQKEIVAQIEEEQKLVDSNKQLIEIFDKKIKDKISEVWGE